MYVCHVWQGRHGSWLFYANVYICMYLCLYVTVWQGCQGSLLWRNDYLCRWMTWRDLWNYGESSGKTTPEKSTRSVSCGYELILCDYTCLCYGKAMLRDTSSEWKQCDLRHVGTSMDKTIEARPFGKDSVVLGYAVLVLCTCSICSIVYIWCCVLVVYMVLYCICSVAIDGIVYMLDMWCCVHIVLCACWICIVVCIWHCAHVGYAVMYTYGDIYMLYMQCYVHMVFCACCICDAMYIWWCVHDCTCGDVCMWCCVHVVHVVLCAYRACGVVYMWCPVHVVHVVLCRCGVMYTML